MSERPHQVGDRQARGFDLPDEGGAVATRQASAAPLGPRQRRRRVRSVVLVAIASVLLGGAMSYVPRSPREITQVVEPRGPAPRQSVEMRLVERSRGFPLRTWTARQGPAEQAIKEYARVEAYPMNAVLNVLVVMLAGLLLLVTGGRPAPTDQTGPRRTARQ